MPSSYSTSLRFELQATGENTNLWGVRLDNALARADDAIAGFVAIPILADYIVQSANDNTTADQARRAMLKFTSTTLTGNANITIPAVSKQYVIWNAANYPIVITTGSGATVAIDVGDIVAVLSDGTNVQTLSYGGLSLKDYIAAQVISGGATFPAVVGNAGKFLYTDGSSAFWKQAQTVDLGDYATKILGVQVALAVAL